MRSILSLCLALALLSACGGGERAGKPVEDPFAGGSYKIGKPYTIKGRTYYPEHDPDYNEIGIASWYGDAFHAKKTANGELFDKNLMTAAHKTMALPSYVLVTNLENDRQAKLRVNDRGPFVDDRIIDLSEAAARALGFQEQGLARVRVQYLELAPSKGSIPVASRQPASKSQTAQSQTAQSQAQTGHSQSQAGQLATSRDVANVCNKRAHYVQIGAFSSPERARDYAQMAERQGFANVSDFRDPATSLFKVQAGPYGSLTDAQKSRIRFRASGFTSTLIVNGREPDIDCS